MKLHLFILLVSSLPNATAQQRKEVSTDSYDVYSAVLSQQYGSWFKQKAPVLILPHTVLEPQGHSGGNCPIQAQRKATVKELLDKLLLEKHELRIGQRLRVPGPYNLVKGRIQNRETMDRACSLYQQSNFQKTAPKQWYWLHATAARCAGRVPFGLLGKSSNGWHMAKDQLNCGWIR